MSWSLVNFLPYWMWNNHKLLEKYVYFPAGWWAAAGSFLLPAGENSCKERPVQKTLCACFDCHGHLWFIFMLDSDGLTTE